MRVVRQRMLGVFLNRNEVLNQAQMLAGLKDAKSKAKFWNDYTKARALLGSLQSLPTTPPDLQPLPVEAAAHLNAVESTDSFQENFGGLRYSFQYVPLDRLVPVQIFCNIEPELIPPPKEDLAGLLNYALPKDPTIPGEVMITPTGVRFSSQRYGHGIQNVSRRISDGKIVLAFEHPNLVQVRRFGNMLVLNNGNHRAMEMAKAGRTHIPAIVVEHQNAAEFAWPTGPGFWNQQFLLANPRNPPQGARPPVVADFLGPLAVECSVTVVPSIVELNIGAPTNVGPQGAAPAQQIAIQLGGLVPHPAP